MLRKSIVLPLLLSFSLVFTGCSKSIDVADLEIENDLKAAGEAESGQTVSEVDCPEKVEEPKDGVAFSCDLVLEDGSTVTANLTLEEDADGKFQATFQGFE